MNKQTNIEAGNTRLWDALSKTDPAHTKGFKRSGGFSGTAMKPIWIVKRLTEEFGPVGEGWGMGKPDFTLVDGGEQGIGVFCTVACWHTSPENTFYGVGGDKAIGKNKYGLNLDDEAFKKAFTDAVNNAFKFVGVGADIHMGQFDDSKYVEEVAEEFREAQEQAVIEMGDYRGPAGCKTKLRNRARDFRLALQKADTLDVLKALWTVNEDLVKQLKAEWPAMLDGVNDDDIGILGEKEEAKARVTRSTELQWLLSSLDTVEDASELRDWQDEHNPKVEKLSDAEQARLSDRFNDKEKAFAAVKNVTQGA